MIKSEDLDKIVNDKCYIDATESIAKLINMSTSDYFPLALKNICLENLKASAWSAPELIECLHKDVDQIISFAVKKWKFLEGAGDDQEYPEGEEIDEADADEVLEVLPIAPSFLIGYLCEFYLLKYKGDSELSAYLKKRRIPGQRKYAKDLKHIFIETQG